MVFCQNPHPTLSQRARAFLSPLALPEKLAIHVGMKAYHKPLACAYGRGTQIARRADNGRKQGVGWWLFFCQRKTKNFFALYGNDFAERLQQCQCLGTIKLLFAGIHHAGGGHLFLRKKLLRFFTGHSTRAMILPVQARFSFGHLDPSFFFFPLARHFFLKRLGNNPLIPVNKGEPGGFEQVA